ncbi:unnamed protein product [Pieris brassicae]|uniref:Uncharacterized protein n=1 Tax=Pieris brassicae TaxID=7116 RepID=A0A9P0T549_PIEBR|nr:unnamed protein product [Pieris brassicae]
MGNKDNKKRKMSSLARKKHYENLSANRKRVKREVISIQDQVTALESNEPSEMDCQPTALLEDSSKNNENSVNNRGSLQSQADEKCNIEEIKYVIEITKNNENNVDNEGSLRSPSGEKLNNEELECVMVPQHEETTKDFVFDETTLAIPETQKNEERLRVKNKVIVSQQKKLVVQDKTIATQERLIAKQVKVINSLKATIENLELKNDKLTKRNEFLRGSLQRLREKILNDNK